MAELLRFVRKMNAKQVGAIDAKLGVTGSPDEGAVKIVEEACWGTALSADGNAGGHIDEGTHDPDRQPDTMVEPDHQAVTPRRGGAHADAYTKERLGVCGRETECVRCERKTTSRLEVPVWYECRDKCFGCMRRFYSASEKKRCVGCRR